MIRNSSTGEVEPNVQQLFLQVYTSTVPNSTAISELQSLLRSKLTKAGISWSSKVLGLQQ